MKLTTKEAVRLAGGKIALAKLLKVSRQAVQKWGTDVPELRVFQLKEMRPKWFAKGK